MPNGPPSPFQSVVVPLYNEEKMVLETLRRIEAYLSLKKYSWEIIFVSDGSKDRTNELLRSALEKQPHPNVRFLTEEKNHGKGFTARRGILEAQGRYILLTDADLSSPIKEMDKLIRALEEGNDVAIGSRALREKGADVQQSFKRWLSGRVFNLFVKFFVIGDFQDTQCGFKCFKFDTAHALFKEQKLDGFAFDVEILYLAKKRGLKIKEVPVMWKEGPDTRVRLLRDAFAMTGDLLRIKKLHS